MKIFVIVPDNYTQSMSVHPIIKPTEMWSRLDAHVIEQSVFMKKHHEVQHNDIIVLWIGTRNDQLISVLSSMNCKKYLRNVDSCSSDRVLFKRERELAKIIKFDAMLVTYCTEYNLQFLSDDGQHVIKYPHMIDFDDSLYKNINDRTIDVLISGQLSEKSYPMRTRLAKLFSSLADRYKVAHLPHPGHKIHELRHQYFGDKYIELASNAKLSIVCTGDDDSLVMKYLEFAKAGTLPMGDAPSNMPENARSAMVLLNHGMTDSEILQNVNVVLQSSETLSSRILQYRQTMKEEFDIKKTQEVIKKMINGDYDA